MRSMTSGMIRAACSTSASEVVRPRVMRNDPRASSSGYPSAVRTWDGSVDPVVHAEPVETATPSRSRARTSASPSVSPTMTDSVARQSFSRMAR